MMSLGGGTGKSRGWAAFDRDQRRKQGLQPQNQNDNDDPFPPLASTSTSTSSSSNYKLKELYSWADHSLIQDVMAALDDDVHRASTLLDAMVPSTSTHKRNTTHVSTTENNHKTNTTVTSHIAQVLKDNSGGEELSEEDMKRIMERLNSVPLEPEWEDNADGDDVYLRHRKEALRTMRYVLLYYTITITSIPQVYLFY